MKNLFFFGIIAIMMYGTIFTAQGQTWDISATAADHVTATLSGETLTISGTGAMRDYASEYPAPWYSAKSSITTLVIDYGITYIGNNAFWNCSNLQSVTIASSVTSTGTWVFAYSGLTSIVIPSSITSIETDAFAHCGNLQSVTIPSSVNSIGTEAFAWCNSLTSINIPNPVNSIGTYAFYECEGLTSVTLPNSINSISSHTFGACIGLTSITIPSSVTSIGQYAFYDCRGLTSVTIPNSVTSIGDFAFYECSSLPSVTLPSSINSLGAAAFGYCSGLTSVTCLKSNPLSGSSMGSSVFIEVNTNTCILYVPSGSYSAYHNALQWQDFLHINELTSTGIQNVAIQNLKLFPNPVKDELCVSTESAISKVEIYNQDGKMVMQEKNFVGQMNVSSLTKGVYMVRVYTLQGIETAKIIKK